MHGQKLSDLPGSPLNTSGPPPLVLAVVAEFAQQLISNPSAEYLTGMIERGFTQSEAVELWGYVLHEALLQ